MSAYVVGEISVQDLDAYQEYVALVPGLVAKYGGEYLVRGGQVHPSEGGWTPERMVVIRFADVASAQRFMDSDDYAPVKAIRQKNAISKLVIVDGAD